MEVFAAMVEVMDTEIGRIIAKLKAKGQWENTLFLFCADNGACPFERIARARPQTVGRRFLLDL